MGTQVDPADADAAGIDCAQVDARSVDRRLRRLPRGRGRAFGGGGTGVTYGAGGSTRERTHEIVTRINKKSFEIAHAVMHTSGQAFVMAFQAGCPHAQDRALEAIAQHDMQRIGHLVGIDADHLDVLVQHLRQQRDQSERAPDVAAGLHALRDDVLAADVHRGLGFVDITDLDQVRAALRPTTRIVYAETIANPTTAVADLRKLAEIAHDSGALRTRDLARITVDTTVQPKAITFPTDAKLLYAAIKGLNRLAQKRRVQLRQSYIRIAKRAAMMAGRYAHAKQFNRHRRQLRILRGRLGLDSGYLSRLLRTLEGQELVRVGPDKA